MNEKASVKRKIFLKRQGLRLLQDELEDLRFQKAALRYRDILTGRIGERFDRDLSARLDNLQVLIDSFGRQPLGGPCGDTPIIPAPAISQSGGMYEERLDKAVSKNIG